MSEPDTSRTDASSSECSPCLQTRVDGCLGFFAASRNPSNSGRNSPVRQKFSGCHWTPRQKQRGRILDRFDDAVRRRGRHAKAGGDVFDRLMMAAVHLARVVRSGARASASPAASPSRARPRARGRRPGAAAPSGCGSSAPVTCDGMSCTSVPPQATFSTCMPRQIAKIGRSRARAAAISAISNSSRPGSTSTDGRMRRLAVARRRDVVAAGQQQAVDAGQRLRRAASTARGSRTSPPTWRIACR